MVRLFNHWFASSTLLQVVFDAILLFLSVVLAVAFLDQGHLVSLAAVVPDALLFALAMVALNTVVGLYQRNPGRTIAQTTARIVLALLLAVPVAWAIFTFLPRETAWNETLRLAVPLAFVTFVAIRGIAAHSEPLRPGCRPWKREFGRACDGTFQERAGRRPLRKRPPRCGTARPFP